MATSIAQISKKAFDAVSKKVNGVIFKAVLETDEKGSYNRTTAAYDDATNTTYNCRLLVDKTPKDGKLGTYIISKKEQVLIVEGLTIVPKENQTLTFNGGTKTITFVDDVLSAGSLFYVVVK